MFNVEAFESFSDWLVHATLELSYCAALILAARLALKRYIGARMCRLLWLALFVRCLIPWTIDAPIAPLEWFPGSEMEIQAVDPDETVVTMPEGLQLVRNELPQAVDALTESEPGFELSWQHVQALLIIVWGAGALAFIMTAFYRSVRMKRLAGESVEAAPMWLQEIFLDCRKKLQVRALPALAVTDKVSTPSLIGAFRPYVLLPANLVKTGDREQLTHIIYHELVHLQKGDIWISWLWTALWSFQWFNPLMLLAGRCLYIDREAACDEEVMEVLEPKNRNEYGRSLFELFLKLSLPVRYPGLAGIAEQKSNIERRLTMIKNYRSRSYRQVTTGVLAIAVLLAASLTGIAAIDPMKLSSDKAEMMGRVENFFMHNFRDITARKGIEWGVVKTDDNGNRSIRYKYLGQIWDKEWKIMNQVFTFDKDGKYVGVKSVDGFPKAKEQPDTSSKAGMQKLVEKFFSRNWHDISSKENIQWGKPQTDKSGNRTMRCSFTATIWGKDKKKMDKIFTFKSNGDFVSVKDAVAN